MTRAATVLAGLLVLVAPGAAGAQPAGQGAELRRCAAIEDDGERLACFDALAADAVTDTPGPPGTRRYGTRREAGDGGQRRDGFSPAVVHIVGYVYVGPRGRGRPYFLDRDGNRLPVAEGEDPEGLEYPFDAEVVPDPYDLGEFRLRRLPESVPADELAGPTEDDQD